MLRASVQLLFFFTISNRIKLRIIVFISIGDTAFLSLKSKTFHPLKHMKQFIYSYKVSCSEVIDIVKI